MNAKCSRCGAGISNHWESQWPIYAEIRLRRSCQIFNPLTDFAQNAWDKCDRHPAVKKCEAQEVVVGYSNLNEGYNLCFSCHDHLIALVGKFIGLGGNPK